MKINQYSVYVTRGNEGESLIQLSVDNSDDTKASLRLRATADIRGGRVHEVKSGHISLAEDERESVGTFGSASGGGFSMNVYNGQGERLMDVAREVPAFLNEVKAIDIAGLVGDIKGDLDSLKERKEGNDEEE